MKSFRIEDLDFEKNTGLIAVVVQDEKSKDVLMVAYANKEALEKTIETGYAHYWSRSRQGLWMKGESSGHLQKVKRIQVDCDSDTILYIVDQEGVACHLGEWSCFHNELSGMKK